MKSSDNNRKMKQPTKHVKKPGFFKRVKTAIKDTLGLEVLKIRVIYDSSGKPYLIRFTILTTKWFSLKLHVIMKSDDDRALHDHPWWFATFILVNGYKEHTKEGTYHRKPLRVYFHKAHFAHRLELVNPAVTLVVTGTAKREWGFLCKKGWSPWHEVLSKDRSEC